MKKYLLLCLLLLSLSGFSQQTINNYKYVLVPEKFSFLKQNDQYKLNTLSKRLLEDKGFTVYIDNAELLTEIANNKCSALTLDVADKNTMFTTSLTILLKDCKGNVLFKSKEGKSREKDYNVAYNLALREAFESLNDVAYAYVPAADAPAQSGSAITTQVQVSPATATASTSVPTVAASTAAAPATAQAATATAAKGQASGTLYAQPTANGYQLIDTAPKIVLTLLKTSRENYFIAENGNIHGIVFENNHNWFFEYYKSGTLTQEQLLIKF